MTSIATQQEGVCVWCGAPVQRRGQRGPLPMYCGRSCRQRAYEARQRSEETGAPAEGVEESVPSPAPGSSSEPTTSLSQPGSTEPLRVAAQQEARTRHHPRASHTPRRAPEARRTVVTAEIVWPQPDRSLEELLGNPVGARHSLEAVPSLMRPEEKVLTGATGFLDGHSGLVVATNQRFLFLHRDDLVIDWDYAVIGHYRALAGVVAADLQLESKGVRAVIKQIHPRARLAELAEILGRSPAGS